MVVKVKDLTTNTQNDATSPHTFLHTMGSGKNKKLVVVIGMEAGGTPDITTVTYSGTTMTKVTDVSVGTTTQNHVDIWYLDDASLPVSGTHTVSVSFTGTGVDLVIGAYSLTDVEQGAAETSDTTTASSASSITGNVTTTTPVALMIDVISAGDTGDLVPDPAQTEKFDLTIDTSQGASAIKYDVLAGAETMSWSRTGNTRLAHAMAVFAPVPTEDVGHDILKMSKGYMVNFDGVDDYVDIPSDQKLNLTSGEDFAWSFWIKTTDTNNRDILVKRENGNLNYWVIRLGSSAPAGEIMVQLKDNNETTLSRVFSGVKINDGKWHHVICQYDASTGNCSTFIDTIEDVNGGTTTGTNIVITNQISMKIAKGDLSGGFLNTNITQVRLYKSLFTEAEVNDAFRGKPKTGAILNLPFKDGKGTKVTDISGNNFHGSIVGGLIE